MTSPTRQTHAANLQRAYDKGERRFKHVCRGDQPTIVFDNQDPKKWIGKCPANLTEADRHRLLNEAIDSPNGDRDLRVSKKLYVVHDGAIYEAQTSDRGRTYHGYPYRGKLAGSLLEALSEMAKTKNCSAAFEVWVKRHIDIGGGHR